jgi:hypothetical protein
LFDIGVTEFKGNKYGWLNFHFKRHKRVHILNKAAYAQSDVSILLFHSQNSTAEEKLDEVKGITYNLESGSVVATKLERKKELYVEKYDKNYTLEKFTLPNVKEGSIIDIEYTIISDYNVQLMGWTFQEKYPTLWSEYNVTIPDIYSYTTLTQGYLPYYINKHTEAMLAYALHDQMGTGGTSNETLTCNNLISRYVMKDVPALKNEPFISTLKNYAAKISFQLTGLQEGGRMQPYKSSYKLVAKSMLENENFGLDLQNQNNWLDDEMEILLKGKTSAYDKARAIYYYVRDNYTCTDKDAVYMEKGIKTIFKNKKGNVAEINLLLTAMLWHANINSAPVIVGTRDHGISNALYPLMEKFNYVIASCIIDSTEFFLDASEPLLGFNHLPLECYNFHARKINQEATPIYLVPDEIKESSVTSVFMSVEKGIWGASFQQKNDYYHSLNIREQIKEKGKVNFFSGIKKAFNIEGIAIKNEFIDSLNKLDENIELGYEFEFTPEQAEVVYLNPMFGEGQKDNPFKSANRFFPVEMPYPIDEVYIFNLEIPEEYIVEELPKSTKIMFNENEGFFEYIVSADAKKIQLRSRVKFNKATFDPEDYATLRDFFGAIVKKHAEQIVFKKKK